MYLIRGNMSENLRKIIDLESKLGILLEDGIDTTDVKCESIVLSISNLLKKINNDELIYLLLNGDYIHTVIDITAYFKKYKINKKKIKEENLYKESFKKLSLFVERVRTASVCEEEYMYICNKCDVDNIANYLLTNMKNEDIMALSNETDDWNYKLFLFENFKK